MPVVVDSCKVTVLGYVHLNSMLGKEQLVAQSGISRTLVQSLLKKTKFHTFKLHLAKELNENDYDRLLHLRFY